VETSTQVTGSGPVYDGKRTRLDAIVSELRLLQRKLAPGELREALLDFAARYRLRHRDVDGIMQALQDARGAETSAETSARDVAESVETRVEDDVPSADRVGPAAEDDEIPAWMLEGAPDAAPARNSNDVVGRTLDDLVADRERRGRLTETDVALLARTRGLTAEQQTELWDRVTHELGSSWAVAEDAPHDVTDKLAPTGAAVHDDAFGMYLREVARFPLIGHARVLELWSLISQGQVAERHLEECEVELAESTRERLLAQIAGGRRAHAELVCANLRLVISIAKQSKYDTSGVDLPDRVQDGNIGLMRAVDKFDGSKGNRFSTYATWWIRQAIERAIADRGRAIRLPAYIFEQVKKLWKVRRDLTGRFGRSPTVRELAEATEQEPEAVEALIDMARTPASLEACVHEDGDLPLVDLLRADDANELCRDPADVVTEIKMREDVGRVLGQLLSRRDCTILQRRFGFHGGAEETLEEIAADFGITRERVRQIQANSLGKLRNDPLARGLRAYLADEPVTDTSRAERTTIAPQSRPAARGSVPGVRGMARQTCRGSRPRR
jgi:RNA polymerase sigma factor (sigma-70 family)